MAAKKGSTHAKGDTAHDRDPIHHRQKGRKMGAIIDLKKHSALWEDIENVLVSGSRQYENRIPLEKVRADLIKSGKLRG